MPYRSKTAWSGLRGCGPAATALRNAAPQRRRRSPRPAGPGWWRPRRGPGRWCTARAGRWPSPQGRPARTSPGPTPPRRGRRRRAWRPCRPGTRRRSPGRPRRPSRGGLEPGRGPRRGRRRGACTARRAAARPPRSTMSIRLFGSRRPSVPITYVSGVMPNCSGPLAGHRVEGQRGGVEPVRDHRDLPRGDAPADEAVPHDVGDGYGPVGEHLGGQVEAAHPGGHPAALDVRLADRVLGRHHDRRPGQPGRRAGVDLSTGTGGRAPRRSPPAVISDRSLSSAPRSRLLRIPRSRTVVPAARIWSATGPGLYSVTTSHSWPVCAGASRAGFPPPLRPGR